MQRTVFEKLAPGDEAVDHALSSARAGSFWLEDAPAAADYPPLQGSDSTQLLIVGGGYLGLWTAILAKERQPQREVMLLEGHRLGWAAFGRNGGFCEASITHGEENARRRWPKEAELLERLGARNLDEIEATLARYKMDCDYERTGVLSVAVEPHQDEWLKGPGYLSRDQVLTELSSPTYLSGRWDKDGCALVHPGKLVRELSRVATQLGVRIHEQSHVTRLKATSKGVVVTTKNGAVLADRAVLATNAFPSLLRRYRLHTIPVYDYVLMTEPLTAAQLASIGWARRQGVTDLANQFHYYRLSRDNRILFGGYDALYHYGREIAPRLEERPASYRRLASHFFTTFPQLEGLRFTHRWAGVIDTSTRFCAFFGRAYGDRVGCALGFTGLGVGATRFAADVLLDLISHQDTERTRLSMVRSMPMPFPPEPLVSAAVQATRWSLDRADHNGGHRNLWLRAMDAAGLGFAS